MTLNDLANNIYQELDSPTDRSVAEISTWLKYNIGSLNLLLHEEIVLDNMDFVPELTIAQANIYKIMYFVKYADSKYHNSLGAHAYDWSEMSEGDSTIRRVSKNEVAKNYRSMRDAYSADLNKLVYLYKNNQIVPVSWSYTGTYWHQLANCQHCG